MGWQSLVGPAIGLAGSFMGGKRNPASAAQGNLDQIIPAAKMYYNPFEHIGAVAGQRLSPEYQRMLQQFPDYSQMANNPLSYLHNLEKNYNASPGYQYQLDKLMQGANNTAAAGGFLGTREDVRNRGELMQDLLSQDMQRYLENVGSIHKFGLGGQHELYGTGLTGLQNRESRGFDAVSRLMDALAGTQGAMASSAGYGAAFKNQREAGIWSALGDLINAGIKNTGGSKRGGIF